MGEQVNDNIYLSVNGLRYEGWKAVSINRSLTAISGHFELEISDQWKGLPRSWKIEPGDVCVVLIGSTPIITGFVDSVSAEISSTQSNIRVTGRDRTCDLVDCTALHNPPSWPTPIFETIVRDLVSPFKIPIVFEASEKTLFPGFSITQGETVFECLERGAKLKNLCLTTNGNGALVITRPNNGHPKYCLEQGKNILSAQAHFDHSQRYSEYVVRCTPQTTDDESEPFETKSHPWEDEDVKRYRPLTIIAEGLAQEKTADLRAEWEATTRIAKSEKVSISTVGWLSSLGTPWAINEVVQVKCPAIYVDNSNYIVSSIHFTLDEANGKRALLELESADAYREDPTLMNRKNALQDWAAKEDAEND